MKSTNQLLSCVALHSCFSLLYRDGQEINAIFPSCPIALRVTSTNRFIVSSSYQN